MERILLKDIIMYNHKYNKEAEDRLQRYLDGVYDIPNKK